jgi:hypothetical protein
MMAFILAACGGAPATNAPATLATSAPAATSASQPTKASDATHAPEATKAPEATTKPAQPAGDARAAIIAAFHKQLAAGPYRSKTKVTSDKTNLEIVGEVIPPDRMHITSTTSGHTSEQIFIGDQGWMRIGTGKWTIANSMLISTVLQQISGAALGDIDAIVIDAKAAGEDTIDGVKAWVYTYASDMTKASTPMDVKTNAKIWISEATGLIIRNESDGKAMGVTSHTVQTVEYDPSIKIEPPQ